MMILELSRRYWIQRIINSGRSLMVEEIDALDTNKAWDLVELMIGRKPIGRKWVFMKRLNAEGKVEKYKSHLVANGYS
jgi:hypothetical protein